MADAPFSSMRTVTPNAGQSAHSCWCHASMLLSRFSFYSDFHTITRPPMFFTSEADRYNLRIFWYFYSWLCFFLIMRFLLFTPPKSIHIILFIRDLHTRTMFFIFCFTVGLVHSFIKSKRLALSNLVKK